MVVALAVDLRQEWLARVNELAGDHAMVVPVTAATAVQAAQRLPVVLIIADAEPLTEEKLLALRELTRICQHSALVCLAAADTREQIRHERLFIPDFWVDHECSRSEADEVLVQALHKAQLLVAQAPSQARQPEALLREPAAEPVAAETAVLRQLLGAMAGKADLERLLDIYVTGAVQLVRCAGHCFLWKSGPGLALKVTRSQGLPTEVAAHGRLAPADALPTWYRANCRALTRQELSGWNDTILAGVLLRELEVFRGHAVIPLILSGHLEGLLILADKVVGEQYSNAELENLFVLTSYVSLHLENLQLQAQVRQTQEYMERSLAGMRCGLITLGSDARIAVCNPYAARVLGLRAEQLEGADLRVLPSPLGDYLYASSRSPEAAVTAERVELRGLGVQVRVTTSTLLNSRNQPVGSVLLLEDVSNAVDEAAAASRQDTINALTRIIGRLAHDVRTPLTAIKTYAQLMDQPDDYSELSQFWRDTVSPELERLDRLITEQVKLVDTPAPAFQLVDLEKLVRDAVNQLAAESDANHEPMLRVSGPLPRVVADPGPVRDALNYLLRFLRETGGERVGIVLDQQHKGPVPAVRVRMRTAANGTAPDPEAVLDPVAVLQTPDGDLGPAISRQLVNRQGGRVEAATGDGYFEFRVLFPVNVIEGESPKGQADV